MIKKPVRTISGVTPLTVVLKPRQCDHGGCIYCPSGKNVPQSYTNQSPAIMRAMKLGFDPAKQVKTRLRALEEMGHPTDKIELILIGGTFLQYDEDYQFSFVKTCFDALNGSVARSLKKAQKKNEIAKHRCVAMCIENRPDNCSEKDIKKLLDLGTTRVELGVQILSNYVYEKVNRGHSIEDVVVATRNLKNAGFKVGYHVMPGIPYSNPAKDLRLFKKIFRDSRFKPDQLKIYPCQLVKGSKLAEIYKDIGYFVYSEKQIQKLLLKMIKFVPSYCRIMRIMREIPKELMVEKAAKLDLRREVEREIRERGIKINEIRMREIGFNRDVDFGSLRLKVLSYRASKGKEYFLQIVNKDDILFGLLRLRIVNGFAIVRELHVYGKALEIGKHKKEISQHSGFGKQLMKKAEEISKKNKVSKIKVISGVGVREYYRKLGYKLEGTYMVKKL